MANRDVSVVQEKILELIPVTGKSLKFVDFLVVVQLILGIICLRISCTTTGKYSITNSTPQKIAHR